jgi:hypothetical protein
MAVAFVLNRPYPAAPFSSLYLFGRKQDVGFQKAIDSSCRRSSSRWPAAKISSGCSEHSLRIDYLDIDSAVLFSDSVACAEDEAKLSDDERVWDIVFLGINNEDATVVVELGRMSRVTEVDRDPPP